MAADPPTRHTTRPVVTGTSVVAIKYADGVMVMADTLGSYGSLARFKDMRRIHKVNDTTLIASGGDMSDFAAVKDMLEELRVEDFCEEDGAELSAEEIHSFLSRVSYNRRSKVDPLWLTTLVCGYEKTAAPSVKSSAAPPAAAAAAGSEKKGGADEVKVQEGGAAGGAFLGYVDLYGTAFKEDFIATGFGLHMALPLLRSHWRADLSEEDARALLEQCMRVLVYRDCRTINRFTIARVTAEGVVISDPYKLSTRWSFKRFENPASVE